MNPFKKQPITSIVITLLVLFNLVLIALIMTPELRRGAKKAQSNRGSLTEMLSKQLEFTQAQKEKFRALNVEHKERLKSIQPQLNQKRSQIFELIKQDGDHTEQVNALSVEMGSLVAELERSSFLFFSAARKICTEEQSHRFDKIMKEIGERRAGGLREGGGRPGGGEGPGGPGPGGPPPPEN